MRGALTLAFVLAMTAGGAAAQECRLALALGLDVSSSVDAREYRLQTEGLAAALIAPEVQEAFLAAPSTPVMLHIYEWSGWQQQVVRLDWTTIATEADLPRIAAGLLAQGRSFAQYPTAVGLALLFGGRSLAQRSDCGHRTLDIASDGTNNDGVSPEVARQDPALDGVTVNALVLGAEREALGRYYQQFVIQGDGAFVQAVDDYADFEQAMRRKLLRELGVVEAVSRQPGEQILMAD